MAGSLHPAMGSKPQHGWHGAHATPLKGWMPEARKQPNSKHFFFVKISRDPKSFLYADASPGSKCGSGSFRAVQPWQAVAGQI